MTAYDDLEYLCSPVRAIRLWPRGRIENWQKEQARGKHGQALRFACWFSIWLLAFIDLRRYLMSHDQGSYRFHAVWLVRPAVYFAVSYVYALWWWDSNERSYRVYLAAKQKQDAAQAAAAPLP